MLNNVSLDTFILWFMCGRLSSIPGGLSGFPEAVCFTRDMPDTFPRVFMQGFDGGTVDYDFRHYTLFC